MSGRSAEQINAPTTSSRTSSSAWGKTGRVTLEEAWHRAWGVVVDGRVQGHVLQYMEGAASGELDWFGGLERRRGRLESDDVATRDEAIMWVLRRARPDVWRKERPVVWKVWTHPRPADPFGPAGRQWLGGPDKDTVMVWAGPETGRGQREWIINNAHYRAVCDYERQRAS